MKRILLFTAMLMIAFGAFAQYIDLGLPSETKWKKTNEMGYYTYEEAVSEFGNKLPTKEQLEELKDFCTWTWMESGYKVIGPNGNFIYLPTAGIRGCDGNVYGVGFDGYYWSSTPLGDYACDLIFSSVGVGGVDISFESPCTGLSVRLVQN